MPNQQHLIVPSEEVYIYDGGLAGFYCCVHESVYSGQLPAAIYGEQEAQPSLFLAHTIATEAEKAQRVRRGIGLKAGQRSLDLVENIFLSCMREKEIACLRFLLLCFRDGPKAVQMLGHSDVAPLLKAEKHLFGEAHLLTGFVRFADYDGMLVSTISPKNFVLPYIAKHFVQRYRNERFLIYDKTNKAALVYQQRKAQIVPLETLTLKEPTETERHYQALWKQFYKTIAIEARENPRCRMTHMPKRYWENMLEVQDELLPPQLEPW